MAKSVTVPTGNVKGHPQPGPGTKLPKQPITPDYPTGQK